MGNAAGLENWKNSIKLNFLTKGINYTATVYEDDDSGSIRKRVKQIKKGDIFYFDISAKGGQAMIIRPDK